MTQPPRRVGLPSETSAAQTKIPGSAARKIGVARIRLRTKERPRRALWITWEQIVINL
jgi:hypothetical protein